MKLLKVGDNGVGRKALANQFVFHQFVWDDDYYRKDVTIDGKLCRFVVCVVRVYSVGHSMRNLYLRSADGFLILYDITKRESFESITGFSLHLLNRTGSVSSVEHY